MVAWGNAAVNGLRDRATGVGRFDRTQRLVAAHSVLVVTAFYEAVGEVLVDEPDLNLKAVELSRAEQVALATGEWRGLGYGDLVGALIDRPPSMPTAYQPPMDLAELTADAERWRLWRLTVGAVEAGCPLPPISS